MIAMIFASAPIIECAKPPPTGVYNALVHYTQRRAGDLLNRVSIVVKLRAPSSVGEEIRGQAL